MTDTSDMCEASRAYVERLERARELLRAVGEGLDRHEKDQRAFPRSWGPVGDLGSVIASLKEMVVFLGTEAAR